jgi:diguanylate cyclase (GGDEF)-like protein/PAS domain S-box-containing protein
VIQIRLIFTGRVVVKSILWGLLSKVDWLVARIVLVYLIFGLFWIFFSDSILLDIVSDEAQFARLSIYKGWVYIVFTSVLLYALVRKTIAQQARVEHSLKVSEERWKFALEGSGEGVWDWDLATDKVFRSARWHEIYGYSEINMEQTATGGRKLIHPEDLSQAVEDTNAYLEGRTSRYTSEFRLLCKDGSWKWTLSRGMVVRFSPDGKPLRMIGTHTDITERKDTESQIFRLAHYDPITLLPNRVLFLDRFEQDIKKAERAQQQLTLMYLDLDRFKEINDTLGHDMGDLLLRQVAQRLLDCVRASDTVARLGGDEFTIILNNVADTGSVERMAQNILDKLAEPFQLNNEVVYITTSIGLTLYPEDGKNVEILLKNADQAMYAAKNEGRNRFYYFTSSMQEAAINRMRIANDLRIALTANQFRVYYQPIIEFATGNIRKAEALIRWQHPVQGLVSPAEFIPIAEDTGLIVEIGDYVFGEVANQVAKWRVDHPGFQVSLNKSPLQFKNDKRNHAHWLALMQSLGLPGESIVIEITEGVLLDAQGPIIRQLQGFRKAGIEIAIDDFGTGYSSLAYLKKFEIDYVKIDQSFTKNIAAGSDDKALCEAIIEMSHKLGVKVIAEGIETKQQYDLLLAAGCDYGQGYLFSMPVPADEFVNLLGETATRDVKSSNNC